MEREKEREKEKGETPERSQDGKVGGAQERPDIEMADTPPERLEESEDVYVTDDEKFPPGNYFNVRAGRKTMREKGEMVTGDMPDLKKKECGFDLSGDDRVRGAEMRYRLDSNMTLSLSFNPATMTCGGCQKRGRHSLLGKEPMVLVATDQNFPATLYSEDNKPCIAIMRIEHGTMKEIGFAVSDLLVGLEIPEGSIILVGSVSDLNAHGVSGYSEELARMIRNPKGKVREKCHGHCCPACATRGVNSHRLTRAIIDAEYWVESLEGGDCTLLSATRRMVMEKMAENGIGKVRRPQEEMHIVPKGVGTKDKVRYKALGWVDTPIQVAPLSEKGEKEILDSLVRELQVNFGAKISNNLAMDRSAAGLGKSLKYIIIGGSNGDRLGDVLMKMGREVTKVTSPGWRPNKAGVTAVAEKLEKIVKMDQSTLVIFFGLDNGMYYEADEDGERSLPGKDKVGKYHIVGKVEVASRKQAKMLMENCDPIWELIAEYRKAILSPIVRYFRCSCCEDSSHCVNVGKAGYRRGMLADLGEIRDAMLETCLSAGMKGFKVINLNELMSLSSSMEEDEMARLMGEDPVHPSAEGFVTLAEKLTTILEDRRTTFQGEKRTREVREAQAEEGEEVITWGRQKSDWIFYTVSGKG